MKFIFTSILAALLIACTAQESTKSRLNPEEFAEMIKSGAVVLIDVRTPEEFEEARIPGAVNIDYLDDSFPRVISELPKDRQYLLYCQGGGRSEDAVKEMQKLGFTRTADLAGGFGGWKGQVEE